MAPVRRGWKHYYRDLRVGDVVMMSDGPKVLVERRSKAQHSRTYGRQRYLVYFGTFFHVPTGRLFEERLGNAEISGQVIWACRESKA